MWNLWVWLVSVVVKRYIDFLIFLIPTHLISARIGSKISTYCSLCKKFFVLVFVINDTLVCLNVLSMTIRFDTNVPATISSDSFGYISF